MAVDNLKEELFKFHKDYDRANPAHPITRIAKLTSKKLGGAGERRALKYKAMESWGLALFAAGCLRKYEARLDLRGQEILRAGQPLLSVILKLKMFPVSVAAGQQATLLARLGPHYAQMPLDLSPHSPVFPTWEPVELYCFS